MIIKGSQRGSGANLAAHLMKINDNEHVRVHEIRGFASDNLHDAFKEAEAISLGTKCQQYLFSVSLNPPASESVSVSIFEGAIRQVEDQLGMNGQPRAIVFHEKEGRRHAHCVWSRIDADTMTAKQLSFFKNKLQSVSRELYLENGWKLPNGLKSPSERDPTNFTLAEWQQAKRQGIDPRWLKQSAQEAWQCSDDSKAFAQAMHHNGLFLAKGDRRGFVALDYNGEIYALSRLLGIKNKELNARLGKPDGLLSVEETRTTIARRMTPIIRGHIDETREKFTSELAKFAKYRFELTALHRLARSKLETRQRKEWNAENLERAARLPRGLRGLWHRFTDNYQKIRQANEHEASKTRLRHADEYQKLVDKQLNQRLVLQTRITKLRNQQAHQLRSLRQDIARFLSHSQTSPAPARNREQTLSLKLKR
ncbi:relaxase/mobilization nuclease domain-containing protein [Cohaesibacter gelatinilyticus]|uniref:MobA/VirD2-like nuclease domain-containing protein n=1 Tax=Cohaesibacter gelatinilyticus TaxID=372072 RepID=A0A285PHW1_9HYPH|nr:relaxase/mobilization nuclease domain-containing protein [Cohaesibacter gelatinilyticus]SNZ21322.1 hypothetical protein SAMN06265368_4439 [Cohaesibacter gelatinilyticus]